MIDDIIASAISIYPAISDGSILACIYDHLRQFQSFYFFQIEKTNTKNKIIHNLRFHRTLDRFKLRNPNLIKFYRHFLLSSIVFRRWFWKGKSRHITFNIPFTKKPFPINFSIQILMISIDQWISFEQLLFIVTVDCWGNEVVIENRKCHKNLCSLFYHSNWSTKHYFTWVTAELYIFNIFLEFQLIPFRDIVKLRSNLTNNNSIHVQIIENHLEVSFRTYFRGMKNQNKYLPILFGWTFGCFGVTKIVVIAAYDHAL